MAIDTSNLTRPATIAYLAESPPTHTQSVSPTFQSSIAFRDKRQIERPKPIRYNSEQKRSDSSETIRQKTNHSKRARHVMTPSVSLPALHK